MTRRATGEDEPPSGRLRLTLTPLGSDIIAVLAHDHRGIRLTPLATIIGAPVSSIQAALRTLLRHDLVSVVRGDVPLYRLGEHPARDSLIDVAITTVDPTHGIALVLRASSAVVVAVVDRQGFVAGVDPNADPGDRARLDGSLARIRDSHPDAPRVSLADLDELTRMYRVSVGSRDRFASAVALKGSVALLAGGKVADSSVIREPTG